MLNATDPTPAVHGEREVLAARLYASGLLLQNASEALGRGDLETAMLKTQCAALTAGAGTTTIRGWLEDGERR